mmetsp:Transcript_1287/g.4641  ORF Transcript_1287/g.4641 Transcript_1287/m.4641 type:complete len:302 (+) Transcript_1287:153-1058(+)
MAPSSFVCTHCHSSAASSTTCLLASSSLATSEAWSWASLSCRLRVSSRSVRSSSMSASESSSSSRKSLFQLPSETWPACTAAGFFARKISSLPSMTNQCDSETTTSADKVPSSQTSPVARCQHLRDRAPMRTAQSPARMFRGLRSTWTSTRCTACVHLAPLHSHQTQRSTPSPVSWTATRFQARFTASARGCRRPYSSTSEKRFGGRGTGGAPPSEAAAASALAAASSEANRPSSAPKSPAAAKSSSKSESETSDSEPSSPSSSPPSCDGDDMAASPPSCGGADIAAAPRRCPPALRRAAW